MVNGNWKYVVSMIVSVLLVAAGAFGAKLWDLGVSTASRSELESSVTRHRNEDTEKFQQLSIRVSALESNVSSRSEQLHRIEAQTAILDALLKEMRVQYQQFRTEIRGDIVEIKALLNAHMKGDSKL